MVFFILLWCGVWCCFASWWCVRDGAGVERVRLKRGERGWDGGARARVIFFVFSLLFSALPFIPTKTGGGATRSLAHATRPAARPVPGHARTQPRLPTMPPRPRRGEAAPDGDGGAGPSTNAAPTQPPLFTQGGGGGGFSATQRDDEGSRRLRQAIRSIAARAVGACCGDGGGVRHDTPRSRSRPRPRSPSLHLSPSPLSALDRGPRRHDRPDLQPPGDGAGPPERPASPECVFFCRTGRHGRHPRAEKKNARPHQLTLPLFPLSLSLSFQSNARGSRPRTRTPFA